MSIAANLAEIKSSLPDHVTLVAVSKTKPPSDIMEAYETGHRVFGENKVQELVAKAEELPKDIEWHAIGHLQTNKVKYIAPFVSLIHTVDSLKLLQEIDKRAQQNDRIIRCLLQIHIAKEDTKFGLDFGECEELISSKNFKQLTHIKVVGLMGMATFTNNTDQVQNEFDSLKQFFDKLARLNTENPDFQVLSMGMSGDYTIALKAGSNMIRVGSAIFGSRNYS